MYKLFLYFDASVNYVSKVATYGFIILKDVPNLNNEYIVYQESGLVMFGKFVSRDPVIYSEMFALWKGVKWLIENNMYSQCDVLYIHGDSASVYRIFIYQKLFDKKICKLFNELNMMFKKFKKIKLERVWRQQNYAHELAVNYRKAIEKRINNLSIY